MVKVKNIKYTEIPFETKDKTFLKCIEYIKSVTADYKKYLPNNNKQRVSFELTDTQTRIWQIPLDDFYWMKFQYQA